MQMGYFQSDRDRGWCVSDPLPLLTQRRRGSAESVVELDISIDSNWLQIGRIMIKEAEEETKYIPAYSTSSWRKLIFEPLIRLVHARVP